MTGYQKCKIVALWIRAGKPMPLDEFAATIDIKTINDPNPIVDKPIDPIQQIFPGAVPLRVK